MGIDRNDEQANGKAHLSAPFVQEDVKITSLCFSELREGGRRACVVQQPSFLRRDLLQRFREAPLFSVFVLTSVSGSGSIYVPAPSPPRCFFLRCFILTRPLNICVFLRLDISSSVRYLRGGNPRLPQRNGSVMGCTQPFEKKTLYTSPSNCAVAEMFSDYFE